ncbi:hypothetical protein P9VFCI_102 [Rhizobium phage P9VFCI]|uniref:MotA/TolQ/ExbB proton channel domain-containing protein n=3 Tax=Innesvirus TaxID=3044739 RepID=A0A076YNM6_9CAUD|nr:hypothetical protein P10VF_191 [Rhizobium phage vB_RleM_P10VF]YP_010661995.1 hypothetical protein PP937_gp102 [Rhizobium phage P9VFCI]YP_010662370.1 hypothetical protein PP938_gp220 [Rhizobium phage AF3]AIK68404.1 hypothetical protein P10VF_191 [Rhizobium phage vB_RleM_P10VF]QNH71464.1 hypothetical protein AF3_220 [Rhizobium phage AF3]QNH71881.1 hypothetical protein P9VFCI_102 [Rhizobium phage P9VFCI]
MIGKLQRWIVFNCVVSFIAIYFAQAHGLHEYVVHADKTYLARIVVVLYTLVTFYIAFAIVKQQKLNDSVLDYASILAMGLGLIGAIIGMSSSYRALETFDPNDVTKLIRLIGEVAAAGPISTVFGIAVWLLIDAQRLIVNLGRGDAK